MFIGKSSAGLENCKVKKSDIAKSLSASYHVDDSCMGVIGNTVYETIPDGRNGVAKPTICNPDRGRSSVARSRPFDISFLYANLPAVPSGFYNTLLCNINHSTGALDCRAFHKS